MQFTWKIDNYGWLSSYNSTSREKQEAFWKPFITDNSRRKTLLSLPKKPKIYYLKTNIRIYISPYSEISSRELFSTFGHGEKDKESNRRH